MGVRWGGGEEGGEEEGRREGRRGRRIFHESWSRSTSVVSLCWRKKGGCNSSASEIDESTESVASLQTDGRLEGGFLDDLPSVVSFGQLGADRSTAGGTGGTEEVLGQTDQRAEKIRADGRQRTGDQEYRGGDFLRPKIPSDKLTDTYQTLADLGPFGLTLVAVSVGLLCFGLAYWYRLYTSKLWQTVRSGEVAPRPAKLTNLNPN